MACGLMRLPLLTFGVLSCFSLNLGLVGLAGFSVLGATVGGCAWMAMTISARSVDGQRERPANKAI
jgi:uncharacterized membrane protein YuzA (DUF378 family)